MLGLAPPAGGKLRCCLSPVCKLDIDYLIKIENFCGCLSRLVVDLQQENSLSHCNMLKLNAGLHFLSIINLVTI